MRWQIYESCWAMQPPGQNAWLIFQGTMNLRLEALHKMWAEVRRRRQTLDSWSLGCQAEEPVGRNACSSPSQAADSPQDPKPAAVTGEKADITTTRRLLHLASMKWTKIDCLLLVPRLLLQVETDTVLQVLLAPLHGREGNTGWCRSAEMKVY